MDNETTRRDFLKASLAGAVGAALGTRRLHAAPPADVADAPRGLQLVAAAIVCRRLLHQARRDRL